MFDVTSVTRFGKNLKMSLAIFWKIIQYLAKFCTYIGKNNYMRLDKF